MSHVDADAIRRRAGMYIGPDSGCRRCFALQARDKVISWYHAMPSSVPDPHRPALSYKEVLLRIERASPDERVSFAGENLAGIDLASHSLQRMDFAGANLHGADLRESRLDGSDFSGADLTGARMERASLRHAWLKWSRLAGADLRDADLSGALVASADLATARLRGAFLDGAELSGAALPENWRRITRSHDTGDLPFERRARAAQGPFPRESRPVGWRRGRAASLRA